MGRDSDAFVARRAKACGLFSDGVDERERATYTRLETGNRCKVPENIDNPWRRLQGIFCSQAPLSCVAGKTRDG